MAPNEVLVTPAGVISSGETGEARPEDEVEGVA